MEGFEVFGGLGDYSPVIGHQKLFIRAGLGRRAFPIQNYAAFEGCQGFGSATEQCSEVLPQVPADNFPRHVNEKLDQLEFMALHIGSQREKSLLTEGGDEHIHLVPVPALSAQKTFGEEGKRSKVANISQGIGDHQLGGSILFFRQRLFEACSRLLVRKDAQPKGGILPSI